jgi:hypothetical protein
MNYTGVKTGGRKQGTPNKLTKELRTLLKDFIYNELENMTDYLEQMTPKDKVEIIIKLLPYAMPKIDNINYSVHEPLSYDY